MPILLVDPNEIQTNQGSDPRFKSFVPEYQNMVPYVEFFAIRKSEVVQYLSNNNNTTINDSSFNKVNLLGFDDSDPKNLQYTARWTNDISDGSNRDSVEGFGIKSIDIKTNASQVPVVDVTFIDVKGTSLFSKGSDSKYGVLLDWPPPIFILRIKGVYGLLTEYRLNLLRTNTEFNGESGHFEIKANFIGYNIAPLTDISIGYLMAVHDISSDVDSSININQSIEPKSVFELVIKGDMLYNRLDNYKNNSKDVKKSNEIKDDLEQLITNASNFIDVLSKEENFLSFYNNSGANLDIVNINKNETEYTIDINFDFTNIDDSEKNKLSKQIMNYYNESIKLFINNNKKLNITPSDIKIVEFGESNTNINVFNSINPNNNVDDDALVKFMNINQNTENIKYFKVEYNKFDQHIKTLYDTLKSNKEKLSEKIRKDIGDVAEINIFKPTIKAITDIVTKDISRLFTEISLASTKTPHIKNDNTGIRTSSPFPEVWERKTIGTNGENKMYKIYPGSKPEFKNWGEVELVEKIVTALSRQANLIKKLDELQAIENGDSKWTPINPLENDGSGSNVNEFFLSKSPENIYEILFKRYISARDYTYKGLIENDNILSYIAKCEARNLTYAINTEDTLLKTFKETSDKYNSNNFSNFINGVLPKNSNYRNPNYYDKKININNIILEPKIIRDNIDRYNENYQALSILDSDSLLDIENIEENETSLLIDGVKEQLLHIFNRVFNGNNKINMSNKNIIVFMDSEKGEKITDDYQSDSDSDFITRSINSFEKVILLFIKSVNKKSNLIDFFNFCLEKEYFNFPLSDSVNSYKFYCPGIIELPKFYLLYIGFLLSNDVSKLNSDVYNKIVNLTDCLSAKDRDLLLNYYIEFISINSNEFMSTDFMFKYSLIVNNSSFSESDRERETLSLIQNTLINNEDNGEGYNLLDRTYLLNNSSLGFSVADEGRSGINIKIPKLEYNLFKKEKTFTESKLRFGSIDPNNAIDQKYFKYFFAELSKSISNILKENNSNKKNYDNDNGFGDDDIRLQIYYDIKKLYDTWLSKTNNNKTLFDDLFGSNLSNSFKFIDRTMSSVASEAIMDYRNFVEDAKNFDLSIYTILTKLYSHNNFLFFPLQTSMVFSEKFEESEWNSCFKLNIDKINDNKSKPAFVCMYIDAFSSNLNNSNNVDDFPDDGMSFLPTNQVDDKKKISEDFTNSKNNIFVIKVEHGKENQSYFGNIKLNTNEHTNTHEALKLADLMSRKNADTNPLSKGQNLFEVFSQRSYACTVEIPLGNICIQPIMYFELVGVPMFYGGYLITNVEHSMSGDVNKIKTRFKGTRIGRVGVPFVTDAVVKFSNAINVDKDIDDSVISTYNQINPFGLNIYNSSGQLLV